MWAHQYVKIILVVWLPCVLVVASILWLFYQTERKAQWAITESEEQVAINLAAQAVNTELAMLSGDVVYIADHNFLHQWFDTKTKQAWNQLTGELLSFVLRKPFYDQVRILDTRGKEMMRINWNKGKPSVVPEDELQDKSRRYYFQQAMRLKYHEVYISPFDLNIEHGVVEKPQKPVIRGATPIVDRRGQKLGFAILNYEGQRLLNRLKNIRQQYDHDLWLVNEDGYWLMGPQPEVEWSFMYSGRQARFSDKYQSVWANTQTATRSGQLLQDDGLFTYTWVNPANLHFDAAGERWMLVSFFPNAKFVTNMAGYIHLLFSVFITLALTMAVACGFIASYQLQRRRSQIRIRESESRYRSLVDSAPDAIVVSDKNGRIILVNNQTEAYFGYKRGELVGQTIEKLVPERARQHHVFKRAEYVANPVVRPVDIKSGLYGMRKNGSEFPVEISLSPIETESGLLVTAIIRDISTRKQAEAEQRRAQIRYQELVNNLPVGVYRKTPGAFGKFLEVNPAMVDIFEADSAEQLLNHPVSDLYCDPSYRKVVSDKLMQQGSVRGEELKLKTLHGREFYGALTAVVKKDIEGNVYFDGIIEDITERKKNDQCINELNERLRTRSVELEAINRELESFSYSVSHDLRQPLRALDGFSYILLTEYGDRLDETGKDGLNRMRIAAQRMATLIDDLLELSRVSRAKIKREVVDLDNIVNEVIHELLQVDPQRNVIISVQPGLRAKGDPELLRVVMDNLVGNAWKFTGNRRDAYIEIGGNQIHDKFVYYVRDNGVGFDMNYAHKLFGAFQRLHDIREFQGTGIGLATAQRIIAKHGGTIWAEAEIGKGVTFYFSLDETSD